MCMLVTLNLVFLSVTYLLSINNISVTKYSLQFLSTVQFSEIMCILV